MFGGVCQIKIFENHFLKFGLNITLGDVIDYCMSACVGLSTSLSVKQTVIEKKIG